MTKVTDKEVVPSNTRATLRTGTSPSISKCFIGGKWVGGDDVAVTDPASGDVIAYVPNLGAEATKDAIAAAKAAFAGWSARLAKERSELLRDWYELVLENSEDLAQLLTMEQGKPLTEARAEITYAASFIEFFAEEAKRLYGETIPSHRNDARIVVLRQPVGVVAAITPWNFPAAMVTRKIAPALAVGCTTILKPAIETPLTALAFADLAQKAGVPDGCFNVVTGEAVPIGNAICKSSDVRALTFTGSTSVGKHLIKQCANTVKRISLELGGNAPFIVFGDADINEAVEGAMTAKFRNAGQTCVCANRIFVQSGIYDEFTGKLSSRMEELTVGPGKKDGSTIGPLISEAAVNKLETHIADAVAKGAAIARGGDRHALAGTFFEPTLLIDVTQKMTVAQEETFGPIAPLMRFEDESDVIAMANATDSGLAAYLYTRDIRRIWRMTEALEYGMVAVNSGLLSTEVAPFGGVKQSGQGREGSHHGLDEFTELKYALFGGL